MALAPLQHDFAEGLLAALVGFLTLAGSDAILALGLPLPIQAPLDGAALVGWGFGVTCLVIAGLDVASLVRCVMRG